MGLVLFCLGDEKRGRVGIGIWECSKTGMGKGGSAPS